MSFANDALLKLYDMPEKPEENKILETRIDPLNWKQEVDRVYGKLVNVEKDLEITMKQGSDGDNEFDEFIRVCSSDALDG